jgi:large subunit ribosomal protein L17
MSSHRRSTKYFSRKFNARKALLRGLVTSLVEHGRIRTTVVKAKELRRHVEPLVTLGKTDSVATRRLLMTRVPNELTVSKLISDLGVRFKTREGGYTRIIKLDRRPGDKAEMAFIEFVDYDFNQGVADKVATQDKSTKAKTDKDVKAAPQTKALVRKTAEVADKRKSRRAMQNKSRHENRA